MTDAPQTIALDCPDERATAAVAARLARRAVMRDVITLAGPLGSGKTSFARAFIRARGSGLEEVPSPTFTLVEVYEMTPGPPVWHFDLYRLKDPEEVLELGIEDAFAEAISLIEWPERLGRLLPPDRLDVDLADGATGTARRLTLRGTSAWAARLADLARD